MKHINIYNTYKNMQKDLLELNKRLQPYEYIDLLKDTDFEKLPIQLFVNVIDELKAVIKVFENDQGMGDLKINIVDHAELQSNEQVEGGNEMQTDKSSFVQNQCQNSENEQKVGRNEMRIDESIDDQNKYKNLSIDEKMKCEELTQNDKLPFSTETIEKDGMMQNLKTETFIDNKKQTTLSGNNFIDISTENNEPIDTEIYLKHSKSLLTTIKHILIHKIYALMQKDIHCLLDTDIQTIIRSLDACDITKFKVRYLKIRKLDLERKVKCLKTTFLLCQAIKEEKNLYNKIYGIDDVFEYFVNSYLKLYYENMSVDRDFEDGCQMCDWIRRFVEKYVDTDVDGVFEL